MFDVITIGSAAIDVFTSTDKSFVKKRIYSFPVGSKLLIKKLHMDTGGGGTNSAVALSRLGLKTALLGKIGTDDNSDIILKTLKKEKVNCSLIKRENTKTGFSVILDAEGIDRTILAFKGCNDDLGINEVNINKLKTKWFYFSSMLGKSLKLQKKVAEYANVKDIKIAYNPSSYLIKRHKEDVKYIIKRSTIVIMNDSEAEMLTKKKDKNNMLKKIIDLGAKIAIITCGKKEVIAKDSENIFTIKPHKVKIKETTGAGDAFASSFLAGWIRYNDIMMAMQYGIANAESVIKHFGAKNRLLRSDEIINKIKKNPSKICIRKI